MMNQEEHHKKVSFQDNTGHFLTNTKLNMMNDMCGIGNLFFRPFRA